METRAREEKKVKLQWDSEMISALINKLDDDGESYTITLTNYTCIIKATSGKEYQFLKHLQRNAVFSVSTELKRFMDTSLKHEIEYVDRDSVKYYSIRNVTRPFYLEKAYNIDINAAYPTCLLLNKLIDQPLYKKLMDLAKKERLAAIGMLASHKRIYSIVNREVIDYNEIESPYSKYFFYCVKTIAKIIWECEVISGMSFLYSWVDGLYVTDMRDAQRCHKLLQAQGYRATVATISDFSYTPLNDKIRIKFTKDGENKLFNIPIENNRIAQILKFIHK